MEDDGKENMLYAVAVAVIILVTLVLLFGASALHVQKKKDAANQYATLENRMNETDIRVNGLSVRTLETQHTANVAYETANIANAAAKGALATATEAKKSQPTLGETWATCYGVAPANGSFNLDCKHK